MKVNSLKNGLPYLQGINDISLKELLVLPKPGCMTNRLLQQRPDLNIQPAFSYVRLRDQKKKVNNEKHSTFNIEKNHFIVKLSEITLCNS